MLRSGPRRARRRPADAAARPVHLRGRRGGLVFVANDPDQPPADRGHARRPRDALGAPRPPPSGDPDRHGQAEAEGQADQARRRPRRGLQQHPRPRAWPAAWPARPRPPAGTSWAPTTGTAPSTAPRSTTRPGSRRPARRSPRPRHQEGQAGRGPDALRPAHRHPHRRLPADARVRAPLRPPRRGWNSGVHGVRLDDR